MSLARVDRTRAILFLCLITIVAAALVSRLDFLIIKGGLQADQLKWARQYYLGGVTAVYLAIRDAILSWQAEAKLWPYLPGYPAFLAFWYKIGVKDLAFVRLIQAAIDSLAILPLYFVLRRIGSSALPAFVGCLIYAASPWGSAGSTFLLAEALAPALVVVLLAAMVLMRDRATTALDWFLLGLFASLLPFFRSEMALLFGPLAIWALMVAPKQRRVAFAACVVAGFALPLVLWSARNAYVHGQFMLLPPAKWYNAWSGLGQVANDFGYVVGDDNAGNILASHGISYHSAQAEAYWFREYVAAWVNHPGHAIRAILYRFGLILGQPDNPEIRVPGFVPMIYQAMAFITPIALIWLLWARRWTDAFLIALPMLYALGSLGILYVETRYVRYAGLTYLLVLPVVLGEGLDALHATLTRRWGFGRSKDLKPFVGVTVLVGVAGFMVSQLVSMTRHAQDQAMIDRLDPDSSVPPTSDIDKIAFRPAVPSVEMSRDAAGVHFRTHALPGQYLLLAPIGAEMNMAAIFRYRVTLLRGTIGIGVLTGDSAKWLSHASILGEPGKGIEGKMTSSVERGSQFVIDAQPVEGEVSAVANKLEWALVCLKPFSSFRLFFDRTSIQVTPCPHVGSVE